jgi:spore germination protein YaaH
MVYDYSYPYSGVSGPIAPISWVDSVLEYATDKIPKEKIWLGVHLYSYEWISNGDFSSYTYGRVKEIVQDPDVNSTYDSSIAEGVAEYPCIDDKTSCILYYQTPEGVQTRLELAKRYGIKGVAFWRLGGNDDILE